MTIAIISNIIFFEYMSHSYKATLLEWQTNLTLKGARVATYKGMGKCI